MTPNLKRLFNPASIAVIGGGAWAEAVLNQARAFGFAGKLFAVHPSKKEVAGVPAYPGAHLLPEAPDAAFVGINREASVGAIERLRKSGAGGAVCFASGHQAHVLRRVGRCGALQSRQRAWSPHRFVSLRRCAYWQIATALRCHLSQQVTSVLVGKSGMFSDHCLANQSGPSEISQHSPQQSRHIHPFRSQSVRGCYQAFGQGKS